MPSKAKPRLCVVALNLRHYWVDSASAGWGGVERQMTGLLPRLQPEFDIVALANDEGQRALDVVHGVPFVRTFFPYARKMRLLYPFYIPARWFGPIHALRLADADLYLHPLLEAAARYTAFYCRQAAKPFVLALASDSNVNPPALQDRRLRRWLPFIYQHARAVVAQTRYQQSRLAEHYGVDSRLIPPMIDTGFWAGARTRPGGPEGPGNVEGPAGGDQAGTAGPLSLIWVGRMSPEKGLLALYRLAKGHPSVGFTLVGGPLPAGLGPDLTRSAEAGSPHGDASEGPLKGSERGMGVRPRPPPGTEAVLKGLARLGNVRFLGVLPPEGVRAALGASDALLNTSPIEGYPITFLESWSMGLPVLSLNADPDRVLGDPRMGFCAHGDEAALSEELGSLRRDPGPLRSPDRARIRRRYVAENHSVGAVVPKWTALLRDALSAGASRPLPRR